MRSDLDYPSFKAEMYNRIVDACGEEADVVLRKVMKNNSLELDCIGIFCGEKTVSPNFYLQAYYQRYERGEGIPEMIDEMMGQYNMLQERTPEIDMELSFERMHDKIVYRLVSLEKNRKMLSMTPHIPFLDMAVVFYCLMMQTESGIGSVCIHNALMERWELSEEVLYQLAKDNTERIFPRKIMALTQMIEEEMGMAYEAEAGWNEMLQDGAKDMPYILTNSNGINGAAAMLYPDCLKEIAEMMQGDFFILPSSIHEVLVISAKTVLNVEELEHMVKEVNHTCVLQEEVLSEHIYCYHAENETIEICKNGRF